MDLDDKKYLAITVVMMGIISAVSFLPWFYVNGMDEVATGWNGSLYLFGIQIYNWFPVVALLLYCMLFILMTLQVLDFSFLFFIPSLIVKIAHFVAYLTLYLSSSIQMKAAPGYFIFTGLFIIMIIISISYANIEHRTNYM